MSRTTSRSAPAAIAGSILLVASVGFLAWQHLNKKKKQEERNPEKLEKSSRAAAVENDSICIPGRITIVYATKNNGTCAGKEMTESLKAKLEEQSWVSGKQSSESGDLYQEEKKDDSLMLSNSNSNNKSSPVYEVQTRSMESVDWMKEFLPEKKTVPSSDEAPPVLLLLLPTESQGTEEFVITTKKMSSDWRIEKMPLKSLQLAVGVFGTGVLKEQEGGESSHPATSIDKTLVEGLGAQRLNQATVVTEGDKNTDMFQQWMTQSVFPSLDILVQRVQEARAPPAPFFMEGAHDESREPAVADVEDLAARNNQSSCSSSAEEGNKGRTLPDYGKTPIQVDKIRLSKITKFRRKDLDGKSLIAQTLEEMEHDADFQDTVKRLKTMGAKGMSMEERKQRRRALDHLGVPEFRKFIAQQHTKEFPKATIAQKKKACGPHRGPTEVLQLNIGLYCNQACSHCHVESSPRRKEMMDMAIADQCLLLLKNSPEVTTLDITGGAPELNRTFRHIVKEARKLRPDVDIIDRCNLTVLHEPNQADLVDFLKEHEVHIIASLPCYSAKNVNQQRGSGVFERSISALLMLNEVGYGSPQQPKLQLDLVYNPLGAFLPPPQAKLEGQYKKELEEHFGIVFNQLFTMTNMPIKRFADFLHKRGELEAYMELLVRNFNLDTVKTLMCTNTVSVGYDGKIFDCDFNQQLGLGIGSKGMHEGGLSVFDISKMSDLSSRPIVTDNHCFGCTAGMGSS